MALAKSVPCVTALLRLMVSVPLSAMALLGDRLPVAPPLPNCRMDDVIVVAPVYVLAPVSVSVAPLPEPELTVSEPPPPITPLIVPFWTALLNQFCKRTVAEPFKVILGDEKTPLPLFWNPKKPPLFTVTAWAMVTPFADSMPRLPTVKALVVGMPA